MRVVHTARGSQKLQTESTSWRNRWKGHLQCTFEVWGKKVPILIAKGNRMFSACRCASWVESLMGTRLCTHRWKLKPLEKRARETKISWILKTKQNSCQLVMLKSQKWQIVLHMAALPIWGSSKCQWSLLSAPDESWQMRFPNWSVISICCTPH